MSWLSRAFLWASSLTSTLTGASAPSEEPRESLGWKVSVFCFLKTISSPMLSLWRTSTGKVRMRGYLRNNNICIPSRKHTQLGDPPGKDDLL